MSKFGEAEYPDMRDAEEQMTAEQATASVQRERNFYQPKEALELREPELSANGERVPPTPEQQENMDRRLLALSQLLDGTEMNWQIDGGLAISAHDGRYHGYHKDIDLSLDVSDVPELQRRALEHGYGLFMGELFEDKSGEVQYAVRPASADQFIKERHHRFLVRVDTEGKIQTGGDLDFIDIHLRPRNSDGLEFGTMNVPMPESWDTSTEVNFHGVNLKLPSLAKVAYFKLNAHRPIDDADLRTIARSEHFSKEQFTEVEKMLEAERLSKIESMRKTAEEAVATYNSTTTQKDMENLFLSDEGNWTRDINPDGRRALGALFFGTAKQDLETAKEQIVNALANILPHEREDRLAEMKKFLPARAG